MSGAAAEKALSLERVPSLLKNVDQIVYAPPDDQMSVLRCRLPPHGIVAATAAW